MSTSNTIHKSLEPKPAESTGYSQATSTIFRPIQYLGSKLRSIDFITDWASNNLVAGSTVLDPFTGSSVVSQAFADSGYKVVASDSMAFCANFAESLLNVGREDALSSSFDSLRDAIKPYYELSQISNEFEELCKKERSAIEEGDALSLFELQQHIPQSWNSARMIHAPPIKWSHHTKKYPICFEKQGAIVASHYAGTYFGVSQSIEIDRIRMSIELAYIDGVISKWERASALTALLHSCSSAVFSPGKHFAQYHRVASTKDTRFHEKRIKSDRSIDIFKTFLFGLQQVLGRIYDNSVQHLSMHNSIEELIKKKHELPKINLIYADPPYTAQQYSRFYHIPETIATMTPPEIQYFRGSVTAGLYPEKRFKSHFSSKRNAPKAFEELVGLGRHLGADLMISYSESTSGITGNDRMIKMKDLLSICKSSYKKVSVEGFSHSYRQFNGSSSALRQREDEEYCVICKLC